MEGNEGRKNEWVRNGGTNRWRRGRILGQIVNQFVHIFIILRVLV